MLHDGGPAVELPVGTVPKKKASSEILSNILNSLSIFIVKADYPTDSL
jgi:hypothetical protein